ncbi:MULTISPECIES: YceI family protein [Flavobacterium]|uniref:Polyisoprenoid-binding protein n=1 Tax=Flavobacterium ranwuense TaxID=2541725 RepID=A0ABY2DQI8_9FLAO|nr:MULTISPECIES: YceI family protein [Flavobacterium]TDE28797.1 polyisoprenoid-binding protein [Flavobacterium ranwuense]TDE53013.1 polyisoprenoid-binding protein [Flavobacterium sp. GT3P67]
MKKITTIIATLFFSTFLLAQTTWKVDPMHSKLAFSTGHMGISDISGLFKTFEATATTSKADFSNATFELSTDLASIDTEVEMRDNHLRSADFFDVEKYPKMTFKSISIKKIGKEKGKYKLMGTLTLHGITKPITLNMWYRGSAENPQSKTISAGFQFSGILKRSDFNIGTKFPAPMISDEVKIKADCEFIKQ